MLWLEMIFPLQSESDSLWVRFLFDLRFHISHQYETYVPLLVDDDQNFSRSLNFKIFTKT